MNSKKSRTGMLLGIIGAILTLLGDLLIGANPSSGIDTGSQHDACDDHIRDTAFCCAVIPDNHHSKRENNV